jgi:hypothetical protein
MVKKVIKSIGAFAAVAFLLLGVLFGMQIMTFIFAQLGPNSAAAIDDVSFSVSNETGAWLNETTYTVATSTVRGFGNLVITSAINTTDNSSIGTGNFSVSGSGFTNASATNWVSIWVSYTYTAYSDQRNAVDDVNNNSLQGIVSYTGEADTQMTTVAIAITLAILIALFLLFWVFFIKPKKNSETRGANFG